MEIFQFVHVNWTVIISINLLTHFAKSYFALIRPYAAYIVLGFSALYAILVSLFSEIGWIPALEAGFLHAAVASYVYSLLKRPSESRTVAQIRARMRKITFKP
jgi:hypothetical protein